MVGEVFAGCHGEDCSYCFSAVVADEDGLGMVELAIADTGGDYYSAGVGYNAETDEFGNMAKMGIIDPTKVVRSALVNAASIANMVLITEALVTDIPEKERGPAMPGGGMEGMY